ncbi:hypothetical protein ACFXPR_08530 [Nocardia tengchongensis]
MWKEIGTTVRVAIKDWGTTARLCVVISALTLAAIILAWSQVGR